MKNDLISIIVPVYNVEKYLKRCIESITNQTYKNIEIILVDDGSTDNSSKICDEYKNKDKRIKVIHKTNGGISSARNRGLDIAKGDYIGFVDSDDYISPNMYEILYKELINNKVDISSCDSIIFKDNDIQFKKIESYKKYIMNKLEAIETLIRNNNNVNPSAWNKLYKKKLFKNVRYPEGYVYEDILTTYLVIEKSNKLIHIKYPLYAYNNRSESIIHNKKNKIKTIYDQLEMIEQRSNLIINKYPKLRKNVINNYVLHILYLYIDFYNIKNIILDDKIKHRFNYIKTIDTKLIDKKIIGKRNYIFFKTYRINKYLLILICHIYKYYKVIKRSFILKQSKKRQYINCRKISSFRLFLRKFKHFGLKYKCNMCHSLLRYMFPYGIDSPIFKEKNIIGGGYRKDVYCPVCNCTDRDRFLYFYIKKYTNILTSKVNILHFAPETEIL